MDQGRVLGLYTAPRAGAPVDSHDSVELEAGAGIAGDRYALKLGYWSDPRWPDQEVTLVESEVAAALGVGSGDLRRNIVTAGVRLEQLIGVRFQIGDAILEGIRPCDPCQHLESLTRPGLMRELTGRGGLRARVLRSGRIATGDGIIVPAAIAP